MSNTSFPEDFILTQEYRRFAEFCDACRRDRYIGLCYGPPGVGKTLSARCYAKWVQSAAYPPSVCGADTGLAPGAGSTTVFYTPAVVNSPGRIAQDIQRRRHHLWTLVLGAVFREQVAAQQAQALIQRIRRAKGGQAGAGPSGAPSPREESGAPAASDSAKNDVQRRAETPDPTRLIIIDETDRLKTASLEQVRDIFDRGDVGVVLMGMPGLEKRLSRYPQLYSRVGFVHAFRPLSAPEVRHLLQEHWLPAGVTLPAHSLSDPDALAAIIRISGGNFRLLHRLLTQIARLVDINNLSHVTTEVVDAARETLVIGTT
jgi:DNA transposition AAA+ family ATPase